MLQVLIGVIYAVLYTIIYLYYNFQFNNVHASQFYRFLYVISKQWVSPSVFGAGTKTCPSLQKLKQYSTLINILEVQSFFCFCCKYL